MGTFAKPDRAFGKALRVDSVAKNATAKLDASIGPRMIRLRGSSSRPQLRLVAKQHPGLVAQLDHQGITAFRGVFRHVGRLDLDPGIRRLSKARRIGVPWRNSASTSLGTPASSWRCNQRTE
jgi:hypothetical protein